MVEEKTARAVISFLVLTGFASPLDVGVCVLGEKDGKRAWRILNELKDEGYVVKPCHATYRGKRGLAAHQMGVWE